MSRSAATKVRVTDLTSVSFLVELNQDVAAGELLRVKADGVTILMTMGVEKVCVEGDCESWPVEQKYTLRAIRNNWFWHTRALSMSVVRAPVDVRAGAKLRVRLAALGESERITYGHDSGSGAVASPSLVPGFSLSGINLGFSVGRVDEPDSLDLRRIAAPVEFELIPGPVDHMEAYLKCDGRLLVEHFDERHNPADGPDGLLITETKGRARQHALAPGVKATVIKTDLPAERGARVVVSDPQGRRAVSNSFPGAQDGTPVFFGEFHWHCKFSGDGQRDLARALESARDELGLDFAGPADHIFSGRYTYGTADEQIDICRQFDAPGCFCTIPGAEMGSGYGHINFYADSHDHFLEMCGRMDPARDKHGWPVHDYPWEMLREMHMPDHSLLIPHHTNADSFVREGVVRPDTRLPAWNPMPWPTPAEPDLLRLAEIVQCRGSFEQETPDPKWKVDVGGFGASVRSALMKGYRLGFVGGTDNHCGWPTRSNLGPVCGLTAIQASRLDLASLFDAMVRRRTYATSGARVVADATLNDLPLGSELKLEPGAPRRLRITIHGTSPIEVVQVISAGIVLADLPVAGQSPDFETEWEDERPGRPLKNVYYYVRARQADGHCLWLSPFWIDLAA